MRVFANIPLYGSVQLAGTYTVNATGTVITFTPLVPYPGGTAISVYSNYDSTTTDLAGNALQSLVATFTTALVADTTPPTVVMVTPPDGATGIGPAAIVTLTFSEPLHPATVTNDTFTLFAGDAEITPSVTRSADNTTVFLTTTLPFDSVITVVATSDVTDPSGNALADFSSTFTTGSTVETVRPQILTQRPTGPGIPADTEITLFVSKPLNESTVAGALYVAQNGVLVEGAVTVSGGGTAVHFNPATAFTPGASVQVFMTSRRRGSGRERTLRLHRLLHDSRRHKRTRTNARSQQPVLLPRPPIRLNAVIDVEFSEPLLESTVTSTNFYVRDEANLPVAGTVSLRNGGRTVRFVREAPVVANSYNYVYPTSGLRDLQNTPFAGTNFYFYTGTAPDSTPPALSRIAPTNGAPDIGVNATVRLQLSESINPLTATAATLSLSWAGGVIPASVTFNTGNTVVTLVPQVPLPASTTVTVSLNGLQDVAGNPIATQSTQFTTGPSADTVRPTVVASNITVYGANNVPTNASFQITFDEPMDVATVLAQTPNFLYDYGVGVYRTGTSSMSADGLTMTFVPDAPLAVNRQHALVMSAGFDLSGNQQNGYSIVFSTIFAGDTAPPVVTAVNPVDGSIGVPRNARVEIRFNESIRAQNLGNVRLLTNGGSTVAVTRTLADGNRVLTLRPTSLLASNRNFTVSVSGVRDTAGNLMAGTFTSTFTTGSRTDLLAPAITSSSPAYDDSGIGVNAVARVTFSEPIDPLSISGTTFRMLNVVGGDDVAAVVTLASDRRSATLTPSAAAAAVLALLLHTGLLHRRGWQHRQRDRDLLLHRRHARRHRANRGHAVASGRRDWAAGQHPRHGGDERGDRRDVGIERLDSTDARGARQR